MNSFQFYEPIGKGKHSTVYKARRKKSIEYFAIKSVDACQKSKVLHEVRMLHMLDHSNVLKFYSWYETSAHLWLVLEYCVGGDLLTLLKQDSKLPEHSIHELGYGIVKALQYIHSKGVIYADLKPSNILLDENGHIKLCDFGMARKLSDVSRTPLSTLTQPKRGAPCYMAPELFEDGGVHSYASDLWALGCVLYECYAGRPPFAAKEFTQLVKSILSDPTPPLLGTPSPTFVSLVNSLLIKNPFERIKWLELCGHPFWKVKIPFCILPPQPAFESMIDIYTKQCVYDQNEDMPYRNKTPPKHPERVIKEARKQDENSSDGFKTQETSAKSVKLTTPKISRNSDRRVNLVRLSRIAKSNLQKENEKENYRRATPNGRRIESEVNLENNDMELDFDENGDSGSQDEIETSSTSIQEKTHETRADQEISPSTNTPHESRSDEQTVANGSAVTPEISPAASPQLKAPRVKVAGPTSELEGVKSSSDVWHALWHASDLAVKPVMPARKSDKVVEVIPSLSFDAPHPPELLKMPNDQLELLNNRIMAVLQSNTSGTEKQHVVRYLEFLSSNADAANILANGPIMLVIVKMLRQSKASNLRGHLLSLIGLFIRHSTFIDQELANSGILNLLADGLRDPQEKIRRCSMVALGELLFYISTVGDDEKECNPPESHVKDGRSTSSWQVSNALISLVSSVLRKGEDDLTQLYALRSIENMCSRALWASRFSSHDVISQLCYIYRAAGKQEGMRLSAGSCLVRIARYTSTIHLIIEKLTFKEIASSLVKGTTRERQINLNLLNMALVGSQSAHTWRLLSSLGEDKILVPNVISLVEQGSEILRGKAFLFLGLLCKNSKRWLPLFFCNARLITSIDRLARENEPYLRHCLDAVTLIVSSIVPTLLDGIIGDVQQLSTTRRVGILSAIPSRAGAKTNIHFFPVVLHLLGCSILKRKIVGQQLLQQLGKLTKLVETHFQGRDDFLITLLRVMESVVQDSASILESPKTFSTQILPSLLTLYKVNKEGDARFLCLKILFDVMVILLTQNPADDLTPISNTHFLPLYPSMIEDEDPIPMYAQKLLVMLIDFNCVKIADIMQPNIISQCFHFLLFDLSKANLNTVKLCLALASAPEMDSNLLANLKVVRQIGTLLEFVYAKTMEDFLSPTLALCRAFLRRSLGTQNSLRYLQEPSLLNQPSFEEDLFVRDIADFGGNVGVFLELSASDDETVSDGASECLVLLLRAAPREGIFGFLTNLAKVALALDRCARDLVVERVLHALAYSCRLYVSLALILSISAADVLRVDAVLGKLKKSSVSDAAKLAASELHRLPRGG